MVFVVFDETERNRVNFIFEKCEFQRYVMTYILARGQYSAAPV